MTRKQRRLTIIGGSLGILALAAGLVLNAMRDSIVFFSAPTMVAEKHVLPGRRFRPGGPGRPGAPQGGGQLAGTFHVAAGGAEPPVARTGPLSGPFPQGAG